MRLLAIDPGPVQSAYVVWGDGKIWGHGKVPNDTIFNFTNRDAYQIDHVAIEMIASYGMPVGQEVFETCVWIGRFMQAFGAVRCTRLTRNEVKNHLCHSSRANDASIRQAIIDRFGGKEIAIGKKRCPGPLYGIHADCWAALAVGLTWSDQKG